MKKQMKNKYFGFIPVLLLLVMGFFQSIGQDKGKEITTLSYYNSTNGVQYLIVESVLKKGKVRTPINGKEFQLYLDSAGTNLIGKLKTDGTGKAKAFIPVNLKAAWDKADAHTFVLMSGEDEIISDYIITKSKITLDTLNSDGTRSLVVKVEKKVNNAWVPASDVEMKVGVSRLAGSILSAGDEDTYTTDSTGSVTVELKKLKLTGDKNGMITLAARVDKNDNFGNLLVEKSVKWGVPLVTDTSFFHQRSLWSTRTRTPYWLLFMAYSIIIGVWGTLIYLVRQLLVIKKLGKSNPV